MDAVGPHRRGWGSQVGQKDGTESPNNAGDPNIQSHFVAFQLTVAAAESNDDRAFSHQLTSILQNPMCLAALSEDELVVGSEREGHSFFGFPLLPVALQSSQQGLGDIPPNHPVFLLHLRELRRNAL